MCRSRETERGHSPSVPGGELPRRSGWSPRIVDDLPLSEQLLVVETTRAVGRRATFEYDRARFADERLLVRPGIAFPDLATGRRVPRGTIAGDRVGGSSRLQDLPGVRVDPAPPSGSLVGAHRWDLRRRCRGGIESWGFGAVTVIGETKVRLG